MRCPPELGVINLENTQGDQTGPKEQARPPRFSIGATHLTRNKLSDRGRARASLRTARCDHTKATHQSGPRFAAAPGLDEDRCLLTNVLMRHAMPTAATRLSVAYVLA